MPDESKIVPRHIRTRELWMLVAGLGLASVGVGLLARFHVLGNLPHRNSENLGWYFWPGMLLAGVGVAVLLFALSNRMTHIKTRWLVLVTIVLLLLFPVFYAFGENLPEFVSTRAEDGLRWQNIGEALKWIGTLLGFAGEGGMCLLSIHIGRLACEAWRDGEIGSCVSWWFGSISLVAGALWFAFFTWVIYPGNPIWRS